MTNGSDRDPTHTGQMVGDQWNLDHVGVDDPDERRLARRRSLTAAIVGTVAGAFVAIAALGGILLAWWSGS